MSFQKVHVEPVFGSNAPHNWQPIEEKVLIEELFSYYTNIRLQVLPAMKNSPGEVFVRTPWALYRWVED